MCWTRHFATLTAVSVLCGGALFAQTRTTPAPKTPIQKVATSKTATSKTAVPTGRRSVQVEVNRQEPQKSRPEAQPLRVQNVAAEQPVDPALEKILADWELQSGKVQTLYCTFKKFRYNHKWQIEYRSEGQVVYKAPDHGVYWQTATKITDDMQGRKLDQNNRPIAVPYQLQADKAERWVCNEAEKTYQQHEIPADMRGKNIVEGPLPFLFGMKADAAKKRYWMKLAKHNKEAHEIWINVMPKTKMDAANYQRATVVIDDTQFTPKAVRLIDPTGMEEIVHTFQDMKVNPTLSKKSDPFNPSLARYKPIVTESLRVATKPDTKATR
jgi:TIGR03009 family protein